jgi:hypothetical protein
MTVLIVMLTSKCCGNFSVICLDMLGLSNVMLGVPKWPLLAGLWLFLEMLYLLTWNVLLWDVALSG